MNFKDVLNNIDKKYLLALAAAILAPFIYSWVRVFWIADQGSSAIATTSFQSYMQMFMEIIGAFLLVPILTFRKEEYKQSSYSIFIGVVGVILIAAIVGVLISQALVKPVYSLNPFESKSNIRIYLTFSSLTTTLLMFEQFLISEIVVDKKTNKAIYFVISSISIKVIIDILFLSNISPFDFSIILISLSSFISCLLVTTILVVVFIFDLIKDEEKNNKFIISKLGIYFKRGFLPAFELLIRNLCYTFVTLQIALMLGESDWNAWNMGGFIYWMIIFKFTSIFEYHLLTEMLNEDKKYSNKLAQIYLITNMVIIVLLGILLSVIYLPLSIGNESWSRKALILSLANIPIMMIIGIQNLMKTKFLSNNKYIYLFIATTINLIIFYIPLLLMIYVFNIQFGFVDNYIIFGISCLIPTIINAIQLLWMEEKIYGLKSKIWQSR